MSEGGDDTTVADSASPDMDEKTQQPLRMSARVRWVGHNNVMLRYAAGLERRVKILVSVVHLREAEGSQMAHHSRIAVVRVIDAQ